MLALDHTLFLALNAGADAPQALLQLALFSSRTLPAATGMVLVLAALRPHGPLRRALWPALASLLLTWCAVHALRWALPQPRPAQLGLGLQWVAHAAVPGFPSMHASGAFALAMALTLWAPRGWAPAAWAGALLVAWSRIYLGVHFPLDVAAGLLVGCASALLVAGIMQRARHAPRTLTVRGRSWAYWCRRAGPWARRR